MSFYKYDGYDPYEWEKPLTTNDVMGNCRNHRPHMYLCRILYRKRLIDGHEFIEAMGLSGDYTWDGVYENFETD